MNSHRMYLAFKVKIYQLLGKDSMRIRIQQLRNRGVKVGEKCRIFSSINSAEPYLISIGANTTISTQVEILTHDNSAIKVFEKGTDLIGPVTIGENCFIGARAILLPGVSIADNCIVGAGSVVTHSIETPGKIVAGNPARIIGKVEDYRDKYKDQVFDFSGHNGTEKENMILADPTKWLRK